MLKINNLSLKYKGKDWIFLDANLKINSGVWLLEGYNGSGKSTFLSFLNSKSDSINNKLEINPDVHLEIPKSNILLDYKTTIPNVLEEDCAKFIFKLNDIEFNEYTPIHRDRKMGDYSTGEKKAAILHIVSYLSPKLLLLDEYIGNFDDDNLDKAFSYIYKMAERGTIVIAASNENDIKNRFENRIKIIDKLFLQTEGSKNNAI